MKVIIRTDSALHIGTGHVMRCLVLAKELEQLGHHIVFVMWQHQSDMTEYVKQQGFDVRPLIYNGDATPLYNADYVNWLPVSQNQDAEQFLTIVNQADLVIVDHYSLSLDWEQSVKAILHCQVMAIDDIERSHYCDVLLDQTLNRRNRDYMSLCPANTELYTGTQYALLNPSFNQLKQQKQALTANKQYRLLIAIGGIDNSDVTFKVLSSLIASPIPEITSVSVIINPKSPFYEKVKTYCQTHTTLFKQYDFIQNMAEFMAAHELAIGAPGGTTWERACLGIPSVVIPVADNQNDICRQLVKNNIAESLAIENINEQLANKLTSLIKNYHDYVVKNTKLCDGLGAKRMAARLDNITTAKSFVRCRFANSSDIAQTHQWQCLPETRKYALNSAVPSFEEHKKWMTKKLLSTHDFYYIIEVKEHNELTAAGVIRLDKNQHGHYVISIYIAPEYYGRNIASDALAYIGIVHSNITIEATVLKDNLASQALFNKAGYQKVNSEFFVKAPIQPKEIL